VRRVAFAVVCLGLSLGAASCTRFVKHERPYVPFATSPNSTWHGYARHDFLVRERRCTVVTPRQAAAGVPWV